MVLVGDQSLITRAQENYGGMGWDGSSSLKALPLKHDVDALPERD